MNGVAVEAAIKECESTFGVMRIKRWQFVVGGIVLAAVVGLLTVSLHQRASPTQESMAVPQNNPTAQERKEVLDDTHDAMAQDNLPNRTDGMDTPTDAAVTVPIVMYHGLIEDPQRQNRYMIDPAYFEQDLQYLTDNGYHTIVIQDLLDYFDKGTPLPDRPIMLTFDDGYYNNYLYAYPLLQRYHCRAVLSPIGSEAVKAVEEIRRHANYSQCTWAELAEMAASGCIELQNHTYALHRLEEGRRGAGRKSGESDEDYIRLLQDDLQQFNAVMQEATGQVPLCFTCPFGEKNDTMLSVIREMGFRAMMDCEEKPNVLTSVEDLYHLHRYLRPNEKSSETFFARLLS